MNLQTTAVEMGRESISYEQMRRDMEACAAWLKSHLQTHENRIALCLDNHYWHWVTTLACLQLGKVCASVFNANELPLPFKQSFQVWLVEETTHSAAGARALTFVPTEVKALSAQWQDTETEPSLRSSSGLKMKFGTGAKRILFTSGTTGQVKAVSMTGKQIQQRLESANIQFADGITSKTRLLTLMRPDTIGAFLVTLLTWLRAGTILLAEPRVKGSGQVSLPLFRSTYLQMSPADLTRLLQQVPGTWPGKETRQIRIAGGRLHTRVRDESLERACSTMRSTYGTTELGGVATCDAHELDNETGLAGKLFDNVQVEVVDDDHQPLPHGSEGWIRCKTPGMATEYEGIVDSPNFRDGWFYPGDIGSLTEDGYLRLNGRDRDVLNLGGHKVSALNLEAQILTLQGIQEVCVVALNVEGLDILGVALVCLPGALQTSLFEKINETIGLKYGTFFHAMSQIPRNHMGKPMRAQVLDLVTMAFHEANPPSGKTDAGNTSTYDI